MLIFCAVCIIALAALIYYTNNVINQKNAKHSKRALLNKLNTIQNQALAQKFEQSTITYSPAHYISGVPYDFLATTQKNAKVTWDTAESEKIDMQRGINDSYLSAIYTNYPSEMLNTPDSYQLLDTWKL